MCACLYIYIYIYLCEYRNRLIKIEPSRIEFSRKGESQWRQSETVVSTGMHNVHPARIEKSSQLDCVYCSMVQPYIPACFIVESLVSSRVFFKSSFFDICTIYNWKFVQFMTKYLFLNFQKISFFGIYIERTAKFWNSRILIIFFFSIIEKYAKIIAKNILY